MYTLITVLIVITCLLLALVVLVQNSKGGGLAAGLSSSNQIMGVRRTTDLLEKLTWGLAIALMIFSLAGTMMMPKNAEKQSKSNMQEQLDNMVVPTAPGAGAAPAGGAGQAGQTGGQQPASPNGK